ncbi:MAG: RagB/SusD family nutrient uptake outer membrane protein, partial [Bacteroidales bacterium]|nr:RagB/SusD family nutrient uptake outer membrane protein [Bacteroidales bacterium]
LMYCEAVLAGGSSTSDGTALSYINMIRSRAGLPDLTQITPDNLLLERRSEFAFENQRFFDLLRFGKAEAILEAYSKTPEASFEFKKTALLLPIPQRELNTYSDMTQNPGY